ncbi:uncharacterized protein Nmag_3436 [Natrialba magadii ATCC 43099]|uniref:Uncharacterized protein n=1 Tax=Natrialba magadii (strain ATCC 43099 / DSM 3394 / CCM 3739 / CIP 104546 / IAM 13178 / JCM 8861 / NBRC 102185 / NCIMB 2190 / MS3) TaxID=547559 RepID=D3STB9_NATMM|nr:hypothetical protein [Natrialba magadii]ADD06986.1 uncharacterized protein Nmag_3436 [Natrialba magadii ATCC 43099]
MEPARLAHVVRCPADPRRHTAVPSHRGKLDGSTERGRENRENEGKVEDENEGKVEDENEGKGTDEKDEDEDEDEDKDEDEGKNELR